MDETKLYLIFEFVTMDLKKYMESHKAIDPPMVKKLLYQVLLLNVNSSYIFYGLYNGNYSPVIF